MRSMRSWWLTFLLVSCCCLTPLHAVEDFSVAARAMRFMRTADAAIEEIGVDANMAWHSRYVSEGRDNLDGEGLVGTTFDMGYAGATLGGWYAASPEVSYTEFNAYASYGVDWGAVKAAIAYNHLTFPGDGGYDNEVGATVFYTGLPASLALGADWYYSFEAEGSFVEAILAAEYEVGPQLTLSPSAVLGFNAGYIPDGHDGANHLALGLEFATPIKDGVDLVAHLAYNWGIDADPEQYPGDESLKDFAHGGLAISLSM